MSIPTPVPFPPNHAAKASASSQEEVKSLLDIDLNTALVARSTTTQLREQVGDVVPWVSVQTSAQSLLVQEVGNETDGTTKHEQTVQHTHLEVVFRLLCAESAAVSEQVDEANSNATVDVENEVVLLGGGNTLDSDGVIEELGRWEVLLAELLNEGDTEVRVVAGLDTVANTRDCYLLAIYMYR